MGGESGGALFKKIADVLLGRSHSETSHPEDSSSVPSATIPASTLEAFLIDDSELAVVGEDSEVDSYLFEIAKYNQGRPFEVNTLAFSSAATKIANVVQGSAEAGKQSTRWLKLTEESAKQVKAAGLIPTNVKGVSYANTGAPGSLDKWLKVEEGSFFSNPAALASFASMVAQMAMSSELAAMREMLQGIDRKLDGISRHQRDVQLAKLDRVAFAIQDARLRADAQGGSINEITWSQIQGESAVIDEVQAMALRSIQTLIESSRDSTVKELGKMSAKIGQDTSVWVSVLGRTLELRDELAILELSRTDSLAPEQALNHRAGVRLALSERRTFVGAAVANYSKELQGLSPAAFGAVVLNAASSRKLVNGLNSALEITGQFCKALGRDLEAPTLEPVPWIRAALDKHQRKAALIQVVEPIVATAKDMVQATKGKIEEFRDEIKRRDN